MVPAGQDAGGYAGFFLSFQSSVCSNRKEKSREVRDKFLSWIGN